MSDFLIDLDGFSDETIKGTDVEKYVGKKGVTDRLGLIYHRVPLSEIPKDKLASIKQKLESGEIERSKVNGVEYINQLKPWAARVHYDDKFGLNYFFCLSTPGKKEVCCEKFGQPKVRISVIVAHYATNKDGKLNAPMSYNLKPWVFNEQKYTSLKSKNAEFPLLSRDILVTCKEDQFQQLDFTPCKDSAWRANKDLENAVYEESLSLYAAAERALGRERTLDEVNEAMGIASGLVPTDSDSVDLSSILAEFGSV